MNIGTKTMPLARLKGVAAFASNKGAKASEVLAGKIASIRNPRLIDVPISELEPNPADTEAPRNPSSHNTTNPSIPTGTGDGPDKVHKGGG